jgi:Rps23 Pro-64 3,4-dihydroxylase Tpa1-like proline 4-hydroxylase
MTSQSQMSNLLYLFIKMDYTAEFASNKIVIINDFIDPNQAENIYHFLSLKPPNMWTSTTCFDNVKADIPTTTSKKEQIQKNIKKATKAFNNNKFAFSFERTLNDHPFQCRCVECYTKYLFKTPATLDKIRQITNMDITQAHDIFISKYSYGNFLSVHSDRNNGRVAFILNLSKDWKPEYGGLLHILDNKRENVIRTIVPHFNTLTLFYIPPEIGIPHFVSHLNIKNKNRFAITGWFS